MPTHTGDQHTQNTPDGGLDAFGGSGPQHPKLAPDFLEPDPYAAVTIAQRFFTLAQAGRIFGKAARTLRWWADTGRIRVVKIGAARFVAEAEIQRLQGGGED